MDQVKNNQAVEKLIVARVGLLMKAPFFGNMATRMELVNADEWCDTCATDGRKFYYNTDFVLKLQPKEMQFVFGHEVLHCCYDHIPRFGERNKKLANIAADYVVNADLVDQHIGVKPTTVPVLYDPRFAGMSFEEVYEILYQEAPKINIDQLVKQLLDDHLEEEGSGSSDGDGDGDEDGNGKGKRPKVSKEDLREIKNEIREAMLSAIEAAGAGNVPGGIQRLVKDLTEPKINWRELLEQQIESVQKSDFSWLKPSRRAWHSDAIMPGMIPGQRIDIAIAIDTSGSINNNDLRDFFSEINGIMEQYEDYRLDVWCFDTQVHNHQVFSSENGTSITEYEPEGGGGTLFEANWDWMKENDIQPKRFVMFTDGCPGGGWGDPDYCDMVWIIKNPYGKVEPPFGVWAYYDEK